MTSPRSAPPLPPPPPSAEAALTLAEAALAAAGAWTRPLDPARHGRAISQLYSALRDVGIATRGLAIWQPADAQPRTQPEFERHMTSSAQWLLSAWISLEGVLAFEGLGQLPDLEEPGVALCRAARGTILAWRQPSGTSADRDLTIRRLITAMGFLSAATVSLATYSPRQRAIDLQAVGASLAEVTTHLTAAIHETDNGTAPRPGQEPAWHQPGGPE